MPASDVRPEIGCRKPTEPPIARRAVAFRSGFVQRSLQLAGQVFAWGWFSRADRAVVKSVICQGCGSDIRLLASA